jgi:hypothetical protein
MLRPVLCVQAEFGMSWCAGFGGSFWSAYHELIPRAEGQSSWSITGMPSRAVYTCFALLKFYLIGSMTAIVYSRAGFEERAKLYRFYHLANHDVRVPPVMRSMVPEWPAKLRWPVTPAPRSTEQNNLPSMQVLFGGGYRSSAMSELSSLTRNLQ